MKIAIIGTGNVGKALGSTFARAGHEVTYNARDAEKTAKAAATVGATTATSPAEAAQKADVIVLAVPFTAAQAVAAEIAPVVRGKIVIDPTNPLSPDGSGLATAGGPSAAEQIASWLPGARVVKAFNTLFATVQADPATHGVTIDALYATSDNKAKDEVADLLRSIGFRPVWVGPIARARELEAIAFLNMQLQMQHQGDWRTSVSLVGAPAGATSAGITTATGGRS